VLGYTPSLTSFTNLRCSLGDWNLAIFDTTIDHRQKGGDKNERQLIQPWMIQVG
jgi:hypothetical protein